MSFLSKCEVSALLVLPILACGPGRQELPSRVEGTEAAQQLPPPRLAEKELGALEDGQASALRAAWRRIEEDPRDPAPRRLLAELLDQLAREDLAITAWKQVRELQPQDPRVHHHLGRNLARGGEVEAAIESFEHALRLSSANAATFWRLGQAQLSLGRLDEAQSAFSAAARVAPDDPSGLAGLVRVSLERNDLGTADELLETLATRFPTDGYPPKLALRLRLRQGRSDDANQLALRADEASQCFKIDPWENELKLRAKSGLRAEMDKARRLLASGETQAAIEFLIRLRESRPDNITVDVLLVKALLQSGDSDRALQIASASVAQTTHPRLLLALGSVHLTRSGFEEALSCADRALAISPDTEGALLMRAKSLAGLGRFADSLACLEDTFAAGHGSAEARLLHARLLAESARLDEALSAYMEVVQAFPQSVEGWAGLCEVQIYREDRSGAVEALEILRALPASDRVVAHLDARLGADEGVEREVR